jgi:isochorismate synthase
MGKKLPFAAYRLPEATGMHIVVQKDTALYVVEDLTEKLPKNGFLIAPFSRKEEKTYLIRPDLVFGNSPTTQQLEALEALPENREHPDTRSCPADNTKEDYLRLIREAMRRIQAGEFEKVVLSRIKTVEGNARDLPGFFDVLCRTYPDAFVYLFCIHGQCWIGATPEPFICKAEQVLTTVSLSGTRPYSQDNLNILNWNHKELQEQDYVTRHIEKILQQYTAAAYSKSGPYVARAGNLLHLRTDFSFSSSSLGDRLPRLISALHPTPAVCGMSTGDAMDFISRTEKHSREYYTGFLGPVGPGDQIQLFVNLRCLKVCDQQLVLYVGGGITHDSVPEDEWHETEIKAETLLSVLHQIR